jgi:hypothetical protein
MQAQCQAAMCQEPPVLGNVCSTASKTEEQVAAVQRRHSNNLRRRSNNTPEAKWWAASCIQQRSVCNLFPCCQSLLHALLDALLDA